MQTAPNEASVIWEGSEPRALRFARMVGIRSRMRRSLLFVLLLVSCKDDTTTASSTPVDGGSASSSSSSSGSPSSSSSSSSSSGSPANDSGSTTCNVTFEPVDDAAARFEGYWLIDDGAAGTCNHASIFHIEKAPNTTNVPDPDKSSCSAPSVFMTAHLLKAKECFLGEACGSEPSFVFFAHAQPVPPIVPPNELMHVPDGAGSYKLTSNHIGKPNQNVVVNDTPYTPTTSQASLCP